MFWQNLAMAASLLHKDRCIDIARREECHRFLDGLKLAPPKHKPQGCPRCEARDAKRDRFDGSVQR